jgi:hypothetical protein
LRHDRNTNKRKLPGLPGELELGDCRVLLRPHRVGILAAFAMAAALGGCGDTAGQTWFAKPFDISGRSAGYSFSELAESKKDQRPITANDLVSANGACALPATPAAAAPAAPPPAAQAPGSAAASPPGAPPAGDASSLLGTGIGLGMSECDVVFRAGQPSSVQIGSTPGGDRTALLTYDSGPRAGIYHFLRGGLIQMDAVAAPPPSPQVATKKPAKPKKAASN